MTGPVQTALGTARARFIESLTRRGEELRAIAAEVEASPADEALCEDVRRRLHALYATAQVFESDALADAVKGVIERLDAARLGHRRMSVEDVGALFELAIALPRLGDARREPRGDAPSPPRVSERPPLAVTQTVSGALSAPAATAVLVVDAPTVCKRIRALLPAERFEVLAENDAASALTTARACSPDFVIVSGEIASLSEDDLVRRLQTDPVSQVRATYLLLPRGATYDDDFVRQTGADGVLVEPLDATELAALIKAHTTAARKPFDALATLGGGTPEEIAGRVAEEIRRGIADALRSGRNETIEVGDQSELMAVAWSAISKIRAHIGVQSRGRVRFRDDTRDDAPTLITVVDAAGNAEAPIDTAVLRGLRVLVADDDPAVLFFYAGLLREIGVHVIEAHNGQQALELARTEHPQIIVSDILMPKIDGFALCREIKRDVLLSHVPVILLSWKEDFLQRMRELDAGASGYLRKEAGSRQVLSALVDVLAPHTRLRLQLQAQGEARGRVEPLGILPLLELIARERPDARLSVRDAWNLIEVDIREGTRVALTRTAADGSFARGERALRQLVGVGSGRFSVVSTQSPVRGMLGNSLSGALADAAKDLAALLDAVSATRLLQVELIAFDDEVVTSLLSVTPTPLSEVVVRFRAGNTSAKQLLLDGTFTPADLETHLRELARRGAITGVWTADGDDLVAMSRREREQRPGTLMHSSNPPKSPQPMAAGSESSPPIAVEAGVAAVEAVPTVTEDAVDPVLTAETAVASADASPAPATAPEPAPLPPSSAALELEAFPLASSPASERAPAPPPLPSPVVVSAPARPSASTTQPRERARLVVTLGLLFGVGYWVASQVGRKPAGGPAPAPTAALSAQPPAAAQLEAKREGTLAAAGHAAAPAGAAAAAPASAVDDEARLGRVLPYVDARYGITVPPEQGLLVLEGDLGAPEVAIGDRTLGKPPIAIALPAGRHELLLRRDGDTSFRYVILRAGETRILALGKTGP